MQVQMHPAEHFLNWYPRNTKLYIRGERGKDWKQQMALQKELFDQLVPWLDDLVRVERDRVADLQERYDLLESNAYELQEDCIQMARELDALKR